jgi:wyosine [tRNA(Phe)-imidazoG37] synthetase (radical SAM superfamily)
MKFTFGPVPSRRLGRSLGVNNIPPKVCTYACVYCQLGRTSQLQIEIESFYPPEAILADVETCVEATQNAGDPIDYLTLVPDGEPTLDANLGVLIHQLRALELPVAVSTNASLLWKPDVREEGAFCQGAGVH